MASKIVVIGDINGKFSEVFTKVGTLHTKQQFAFAIIAGDLFGQDPEEEEVDKLLNGRISIPLPTYFALGKLALPSNVLAKLESSDGELCPNLIAFGRRASLKTTEAFRIVSVGGAHVPDSDEPMSLYSASYSDKDAELAAKSPTGADMLITSDWPQAITDGSGVQYAGNAPQTVEGIANLCTALKPRYHFSASERYYEREAFFWNGPSPRPVTRFISLAPYGNPDKEKWIYAFQLEPNAAPPERLPDGCTASPFFSNKKRKLEAEDNGGGENYRYSNGTSNSYHDRDRGGRHKRQRNQPPPTPGQCYFCLSNPNVETHMVASIGIEAYLTISKGPLTTRETFPDLDFPGHILLIPFEHAPTMSAVSGEDKRQSLVQEMQRYRTALHNMLVVKSKGEDGRAKLGAVTWEISRASGVHLHWQFLPVPVDQIHRGLVEAAFEVEAENQSYPKFAKSSKEMQEAEEGDFFKVMIWSEPLRKEMVLPLSDDFRFDLQFGRTVLGKLLGLERRRHWKDCAQTKAEEEADAAAFKEAFEEFDFSLED